MLHKHFSAYHLSMLAACSISYFFSVQVQAQNLPINDLNQSTSASIDDIYADYKQYDHCTDENRTIVKNTVKRSQFYRLGQHEYNLQYNITCKMLELKPYLSVSDKKIQYQAYLAQAWLNYANHEINEGSTTSAKKYALYQGIHYLTVLQIPQLQDDSTLDLNLNSFPKFSSILRPDLWSTITTLKQNNGELYAPKQLAYTQVKLLWAGAEYCERGWRHANEHFAAAERYTHEADTAVLNAIKLNNSNDFLNKLDEINKQKIATYKQLKANLPNISQCEK